MMIPINQPAAFGMNCSDGLVMLVSLLVDD